MTIFTCQDNFAARMTCIYDAWASKLGHEHVQLRIEPIEQLEFFVDYVHVEADEDKTEKVVRTVQREISMEAYVWMYYASLSAEEDALDTTYRFLVKAFRYGSKICQMLQDDTVMRMMEIKRLVGNEAHSFREFARFTSYGDMAYIAHIEPKANVILYVAQHFRDRMPSENFVIIDDNRRLAAVHPKNEPCYLKELDEEEISRITQAEEVSSGDPFIAYWKEYFRSIAIKERTNPVCQRNHFPLWMRRHVTEFV
ncbi:MAG: TIGR03915 family putative DNA repair protein [Lachnospiraceae bacterium]|nr:TIGR03915 family putative DNA repair protein [Lachnospiraceae bacterium]